MSGRSGESVDEEEEREEAERGDWARVRGTGCRRGPTRDRNWRGEWGWGLTSRGSSVRNRVNWVDQKSMGVGTSLERLGQEARPLTGLATPLRK